MYKKILIAMDESRHSEEVKKHGIMLTKVLGASVTVLYVVEEMIYVPASPYMSPPPIMPSLKYSKEEGKKIVEKVIERGKEMGVEVTPMIVVGHPASEIIEHAKDHDLVVMDTLGRSGIVSLLIGSVAEKVVRHAPVPVLVIRTKENQES